MLYLHDIWVNWQDGEENSYNILEFFEWRKLDGIELLDQVPLAYVSDELMDYVENDLDELPKELLQYCKNKASYRKNMKNIPIEYGCIITDGHRIMAFDTMGYLTPVRKSRLIPRQERLVLEMVDGFSHDDFGFEGSKIKKEYHTYSLPPEAMVGLTRKERGLKEILMIGVERLQDTKDINELRYWLTEWNPDLYSEVFNMERSELWNKLHAGLLTGWTRNHEEFCEKIIKDEPFLEKLWESEKNYELNRKEKKR